MAFTYQTPSPFSQESSSSSSYLSHSPVSVLDQQPALLMEQPSEARKGSQASPRQAGWEGHMQLLREPEMPFRDSGAAAPVAQARGGAGTWFEAEELEDEFLGDNLGGVPVLGWEEGSEEGDLEHREGVLEAMSVAARKEEEAEEEWEELGLDLEDVLEALREESSSSWLRPILEDVAAAAPCTGTLFLSPSSSSDSSAATSPSTPGCSSAWASVSGSGSLSGRTERLVHRLRERGYEASVCTTAWASSQGVPSGSHTFVDIALASDTQQQRQETCADSEGEAAKRVVIDLDFASQFEVVKCTPAYEAFLQRIPASFAGSEGTLLRLLELLVEAMRMSLAAQQLPVAPWRRLRFVNAKWTAVVDRAVPALSAPSSPTPFAPAVGAPLVYPQRREDALSQSLPAGQAALYGAGAVAAASDSLPQFYPNLVNLSSTPHSRGSNAAPMLAEPALLSALAAKAARGCSTSPLHPKQPRQHQDFGAAPHLRQAGFEGHLSGAAAAHSLRSSLLKDMVACSR